MVEVAAVVAFTGLLAAALAAPPPVSGPTRTVDWEEMAGEDTQWFGVYVGHDKIGYSSRRVVPREGGTRTIERSYLRLGSMGQTREVHLFSTADLDEAHRAERFDFEMQTGDQVFRVSGEGTTVRYSIGGGQEETLVLEELPVLSDAHTAMLAGAEQGQVVELPFLDPATMTRSSVRYEIGPEEEVPGLEGTRGRRVTYRLQGAEMTAWVDDRGEQLRQEGLMGMVVLREPRDVALTRGWPDGAAVDIVALSAVPVDRPIDGARQARVLVVELHGSDALDPLLRAAHGERWDGRRLGIHVPDAAAIATYPLPAADDAFAPYLAAEPLIEVDDPAIREAVNGVLADVGDAESAARRLVDWVFAEVVKTPVVGVPSARQVLESRRGDCNEHTALYTAMARAAGVPTRVAAGIVYTESLFSQGSFYYHAWPEVWLGEWIPVDPTFGQFPADATHIKLVEGGLDRQTDLIGVIGTLSVDVVEVR